MYCYDAGDSVRPWENFIYITACRFRGQVLSEEVCQVYQGDCRPCEKLEARRAWSWRMEQGPNNGAVI